MTDLREPACSRVPATSSGYRSGAVIGCSLVAACAWLVAAADGAGMELWYQQPAKQWVEALPVGNGRLGTMVFGGTETARYQFNEDTLWRGRPRDYSHEGAVDVLPKIRQLLFDGRQRDAEKLAMQRFMSVPLRQMAYQPCGDLTLEVPGHDKAEDYRRELDIDAAVATTTYRVGKTRFRRECLTSAVDQVFVVHLAADQPASLTLTARLTSPHPNSTRVLHGRGTVLAGHIAGEPDEHALRFEAHLVAEAKGGKREDHDDRIEIIGADAVTFKLAAATNFVNYGDTSGDPAARCREVLDRVAGKQYARLRQDHVADHQRLFRRVSLDLGTTDAASQPTDRRVQRSTEQDDPQLAALYFQFGRYLLISRSRPGCQPANLQGLWNDKLKPPWESKYTTNINAEMNYWPAEPTNLAECHEPLFSMLDDLAVAGQQTARKHYGARGWVLHHNTDLWRGTAPINNSNHGIWPTGGAWLCQHLWEHYLYGEDREFLAERAYPIMKGAAEFFVDTLIEDPRTGHLISSPSNSPEQGGLVAGPTMDHQIIRNLFESCVQASKILDVDAEFRSVLIEKSRRIAPNKVGRFGQLQEWLEDKDNPKNTHRHVSHLWGLHPGQEITRRGTPELFAAARTSLEHRGDGGTGWSMGWKINFWARLEDGDHAYQMLSHQLTAGRTYPNLLDAHPPFQIDGNFGATAGIAEMLLQSHTGEIHLLPALPSAWGKGSVRGLRARGQLEVDLNWADGNLTQATIRSKRKGTYGLRLGERTMTLDTEPGQQYVVMADQFRSN